MRIKVRNPKVIFRIVFIAWTAVWVLFLIRGLVKGEWRNYKNLLGMTLEEKKAYVTGEEFYGFIMFCKEVIPMCSDYSVQANYDADMDYFRFAYYIYPLLRDVDDPEYIACYKVKFRKKGYDLLASLSDDKYILKRR